MGLLLSLSGDSRHQCRDFQCGGRRCGCLRCIRVGNRGYRCLDRLQIERNPPFQQQGLDILRRMKPLLLECGIALKVSLLTAPPEPRDKLREAAEAAMDNVTEQTGGVQFTQMNVMRQNYQQRKQQIEVR